MTDKEAKMLTIWFIVGVIGVVVIVNRMAGCIENSPPMVEISSSATGGLHE